MSLMDALLNEGYDDRASKARNIHVALRGAEGPLGSGTLADPYNGSVRAGPPLTLESLEFDPSEVVIAGWLSQAHGLSAGGNVTIWTTDAFSGAVVSSSPWNGTFTIKWVSSVAFSIQFNGRPRRSDQPEWKHQIWFKNSNNDAVLARLFWPVASAVTSATNGYVSYEAVRISGAADGSFNGDFVAVAQDQASKSFKYYLGALPTGAAGSNAVSARLIHGFDEIMRSLPEVTSPNGQAATYSVIHLGPGIFETRGAANGYFTTSQAPFDYTSVGFVLKAGVKIVGSGIDVTTVKLVQAVDPYDNTTALRTSSAKDDVGISDLTVDCNLGGQPSCAGVWVPRVTCSAIWCGGYHIRVRRVRVINFGDQALPECFAVYGHGDFLTGAGDQVFEDCIVEKPSESNAHETTSMGSTPPDGVASNNRGSVLRHNYLNFEFTNGSGNHPIAVKSLLRDANDPRLVRLETYESHGHIPSKRLVIRGAAQPEFNGVFPIAQIVSDAVLTFRTWFDAPAGEGAGGQTCIGLGISSEELMGDNAVFDTFEASYLTAEYLDPGLVSWLDLEALDGDLFIDPGEVQVTVQTRRPHNHVVGQLAQLKIWKPGVTWQPTASFLEGAYPIVAVYGAYRFACLWPGPPPVWYNSNLVRLGGSFHGPNVAGTGSVNESNAVYDVRRAVYSDTGSARDGVLRDNYFSNTLAGVEQNFSGGVSKFTDVKSLKRNDTDPTLAVVETDGPHRLMPGQPIVIDLAFVGGSSSTYYNGVFAVDSVPSDASFTYRMQGNPGGDADSQPVPRYRVMWQTSHLVVENNVFEGYATDQNSENAPAGISIDGYHEVPPYVFRRWLIRDNFMRHRDNAPEISVPPGDFSRAMRLVSADSVVVDGNVVDFPSTLAIHDWKCTNVAPFNNQTPSGTLIHAFRDSSPLGSGTWEQRSDLESTMQALLDEATVLAFL